MTDSTKQTPPAGAELPRGMRVADMCEMQHAGIPLNLGKYLAHLTTAQLASLGLRRVAEEAGPLSDPEILALWDSVGGSTCATAPLIAFARKLLSPAQGGEAPGGGEKAECPDCHKSLPEPDGLHCCFESHSRLHLGEGCDPKLYPACFPAAPTPEPVKLPDLPTERELREWRSLRMLAHPGPESVRVMARIAFPTLLDAHDALRARVAELTKEKEYIAESQALIAAKLAEWEQAAPAEVARLRTQLASATESAAASEAKLEAARALIERSHLHPEVRRALLAALASDSPTTGKDGR